MAEEKKPIYLDYNSTTPTDERVVEEMIPYFTQVYGNASSRTHAYGWEADEAVTTAKERVANLINAKAKEIIFTSGATEGLNLILKGIYEQNKDKGNHIITASTEHKAVLDVCEYLENYGVEVTYLPVDKEGLIDLEELQQAINDKTILISVMYANNETGVIQPISEIGAIAQEKGIPFMTDATQAVGKVPVNVDQDNIDILTLSGHKFYGPKGIGAMYVRQKYPRIRLTPQIHGGGHQRGFRSGTLNVPAIVGLGKAAELRQYEQTEEAERIEKIRNKIEEELLKIDGSKINGSIENRLPNTVNVSFEGVDAEALIMSVRDEIGVATGSACTSESLDPSHVLKAMGVKDEDGFSAIRISLGRLNTYNEVTNIIEPLKNSVNDLKRLIH
jgi:cysteine desulfurase